jgi:hypothetical protein
MANGSLWLDDITLAGDTAIVNQFSCKYCGVDNNTIDISIDYTVMTNASVDMTLGYVAGPNYKNMQLQYCILTYATTIAKSMEYYVSHLPEILSIDYDTTVITTHGSSIDLPIEMTFKGDVTRGLYAPTGDIIVEFTDGYVISDGFYEYSVLDHDVVYSDGMESGIVDTDIWDIQQDVGTAGVFSTYVPRTGTYSMGSNQAGTQGMGINIYDQNHAFIKLPDGDAVIYDITLYAKRWRTTTWGGHFCGFGIGSTNELCSLPCGDSWNTPYVKYDITIERISASQIQITILADDVGIYDSAVTFAQTTTILFGVQTRHNNASDNSIYFRIDDVVVTTPVTRSYISTPEFIRNDVLDSNAPLEFTVYVTNHSGTTTYDSTPIAVDYTIELSDTSTEDYTSVDSFYDIGRKVLHIINTMYCKVRRDL